MGLSPTPNFLAPWQGLALSLTLHLLLPSHTTTLCPPTLIPWLCPLPQKAKASLELKELSRQGGTHTVKPEARKGLFWRG